MTESQSFLVDKESDDQDGAEGLRKQQVMIKNILKTVNANFELFLMIIVLVSILVTSIF